MRGFISEIAIVLTDAWVYARKRRYYLLAALALLAVVTPFTLDVDVPLANYIKIIRQKPYTVWARELTEWGDYHTGSLFLALGVYGLGKLLRRPSLRRAAIASFLSASIAGAVVTTVRGIVGRPRPVAKLPDGAYGPSLQFRYHSFPSGHAATSMGSAAGLAASVPVVAPIALALGASVVGSRMYMRHHHLTDVWVGGGVGTIVGWVLGRASRRRSLAERHARASSVATAPAAP